MRNPPVSLCGVWGGVGCVCVGCGGPRKRSECPLACSHFLQARLKIFFDPDRLKLILKGDSKSGSSPNEKNL
jgi:hypothetical protein